MCIYLTITMNKGCKYYKSVQAFTKLTRLHFFSQVAKDVLEAIEI